MVVDQQTTKPPCQTHLATTFQLCQARRRIFFLRMRRNKLPTVRLGGGRKPWRRHFVLRVLKKVRLRGLKLQFTCMLRKLRKFYRNLIKDIVEAGPTVEALQQRMFTESTFAVPVMGISFASFPSAASGSDRPRPSFF